MKLYSLLILAKKSYTVSIQHFIPQIQGTSNGTDVNWCVQVRDYGVPLQHWLSAHGINMWLNAVIIFSNTLGVQIACLGYLWIMRNVFLNLKTMKKKIMLGGIHCFMQNKIPKLMSSHGVPLSLNQWNRVPPTHTSPGVHLPCAFLGFWYTGWLRVLMGITGWWGWPAN